MLHGAADSQDTCQSRHREEFSQLFCVLSFVVLFTADGINKREITKVCRLLSSITDASVAPQFTGKFGG